MLPGVNIPVKSKDVLATHKPGAILILARNFAEDIIKNNQALVDAGITFINIKDLGEDLMDETIAGIDIGAKFEEVKHIA